MLRLCRFGLLAVCVAVVGSPATSYGQVGYMQSWWGGYTPYYGGYTSYYGTPYSTSYAPYSPALGCRSCQTASYGCNNCGTGCATGNCATGNCASGNCGSGGCATTANSAPNGTLSPVPDPANSSRSFENRLDVIERHLHINPPVVDKNRTYRDDGFKSVPSRGGNRNGTVNDPLRGSGGTRDDDLEPPIPANTRDNTNQMFEDRDRERLHGSGTGTGTGSESSQRIPLPGDPGPEESVIPSKKPAAAPAIDEKAKDDKGTKTEKSTQTLPLDSRVTSRAVSPRERQAISVGTRTTVAAAKQPVSKLQVDAHPQMNVARH